MAAVKEDAQFVAVAPERGATQLPAAGRQQLTELVALAVEAPPFNAGLGVKGGDAVVRCGYVQHAVDHQRRAFEESRRGLVLLERRFPVGPLPREAKPGDVVG